MQIRQIIDAIENKISESEQNDQGLFSGFRNKDFSKKQIAIGKQLTAFLRKCITITPPTLDKLLEVERHLGIAKLALQNNILEKEKDLAKKQQILNNLKIGKGTRFYEKIYALEQDINKSNDILQKQGKHDSFADFMNEIKKLISETMSSRKNLEEAEILLFIDLIKEQISKNKSSCGNLEKAEIPICERLVLSLDYCKTQTNSILANEYVAKAIKNALELLVDAFADAPTHERTLRLVGINIDHKPFRCSTTYRLIASLESIIPKINTIMTDVQITASPTLNPSDTQMLFQLEPIRTEEIIQKLESKLIEWKGALNDHYCLDNEPQLAEKALHDIKKIPGQNNPDSEKILKETIKSTLACLAALLKSWFHNKECKSGGENLLIFTYPHGGSYTRDHKSWIAEDMTYCNAKLAEGYGSMIYQYFFRLDKMIAERGLSLPKIEVLSDAMKNGQTLFAAPAASPTPTIPLVVDADRSTHADTFNYFTNDML